MKIEIIEQRYTDLKRRLASKENSIRRFHKETRRLRKQRDRLKEELFLSNRKIRYLKFTGGEEIHLRKRVTG